MTPFVRALAFVSLAALLLAPAAARAATGVATIPYQGRLEHSGEPFNGSADLVFTGWDKPTGGETIFGPIALSDVPVSDGLFFAEIPINTVGLPLSGYWIELAVDGVTLSPRQPYRPAAAAVQAAGAEIGDQQSVVFSRSLAPEFIAINISSAGSTPTLTSAWQSFTPDQSGPLASAAVSALVTFGDNATCRVFAGAGTGGALLAETTADISPGQLDAFFDQGPVLAVGQTYTLQFSITDTGTGLDGEASWTVSLNNPYPGGNASTGATQDLIFAVAALTPAEPRAALVGASSLEIAGQLRVAGDDDEFGADPVTLPDDSIQAAEIADEPGIASFNNSVNIITTTYTQLAARSITVPTDGYVFAIYSAETDFNHVNGTASSFTIGISDAPDSLPFTEDYQIQLPAVLPTGIYDRVHTVHAMFRVTGQGTYTFYAIGKKDFAVSPGMLINDNRFSLLFFPTSYGSVDVTATLNPPSPITGISETSGPATLPPSDHRALKDRRVMDEYQRDLLEPQNAD